jgi:hypothetical protein
MVTEVSLEQAKNFTEKKSDSLTIYFTEKGNICALAVV